MTRAFGVLTVAVALVALAGGCRSMTGRTAGQVLDNKTTIASVKSKLVAARLQNLTWVNVEANEGVVYLTGNAHTAEEKARATEIAMRVNGVKRVVNDIHVNTASAAATAGARSNASASSSASSSSRSSATPSASPATTSSSSASAATMTGEVVNIDHGSGNVTLKMSDGNNVQLRLPPASLRNVKTGDRLSVSVNAAR